MKKVVNLGNGEVNLTRSKRRLFTAEYKLKILAEADACKGTSQVGAMLRREGLYHSALSDWRRAKAEGELNGLAPVKPGPKARERHPLEAEVAQLKKENRALERKLKRAEWILEISKKGAELMEKMALGHQFENEDSE